MSLPVARVVVSVCAAVSALALFAATSGPYNPGFRAEIDQQPIGVQLSEERPEVVISYSTTFDAKHEYIVKLGADANVEMAPPPEGVTEIEVSLVALDLQDFPDSHTTIVLGEDVVPMDEDSGDAFTEDTGFDDGLDGDLVGLLVPGVACGGDREACTQEFEIHLRWISGPPVSGVVMSDGAAFIPALSAQPKKMSLLVSSPIVDGIVLD